MANDTQKEYPNVLCYIKWKSLVNPKCICWAKSKYLYTSGISKTQGAALAKVMVVGRENSLSFQELPGKPWPQLCHPPLRGQQEATLTPSTPLWCHSTFWKLPPSLKCSEDRGTG